MKCVFCTIEYKSTSWTSGDFDALVDVRLVLKAPSLSMGESFKRYPELGKVYQDIILSVGKSADGDCLVVSRGGYCQYCPFEDERALVNAILAVVKASAGEGGHNA